MAVTNKQAEQNTLDGAMTHAVNDGSNCERNNNPATLVVSNMEHDQVSKDPADKAQQTPPEGNAPPPPYSHSMEETPVGEGESDRGQWGNKIEFFLAVVGFSIGVGNVFRFPYVCYKNGGGAFLIPYFIALACCGMPLMFLELAWGQYSREGPITAWSVCPLFSGIGVCACTMTATVILYYNVIMCYSVFYMFASLTTGELPWARCSKDHLDSDVTGSGAQVCAETITDK